MSQMFPDIWPGMAAELGVEAKDGEGKDFAASTMGWEPFPDSKEALAYLKQHYKLYTLTTGSKELALPLQKSIQQQTWDTANQTLVHSMHSWTLCCQKMALHGKICCGLRRASFMTFQQQKN